MPEEPTPDRSGASGREPDAGAAGTPSAAEGPLGAYGSSRTYGASAYGDAPHTASASPYGGSESLDLTKRTSSGDEPDDASRAGTGDLTGASSTDPYGTTSSTDPYGASSTDPYGTSSTVPYGTTSSTDPYGAGSTDPYGTTSSTDPYGTSATDPYRPAGAAAPSAAGPYGQAVAPGEAQFGSSSPYGAAPAYSASQASAAGPAYGAAAPYGAQPPYGGVNPYGAAAAAQSGGRLNGFGLASVIIGGLALVIFSWIPILNWGAAFFAVVALVLGILGLTLKGFNTRKGLAMAGAIVSAVALVVSVGMASLYGVVMAQSTTALDDETTSYTSDFETADRTVEVTLTVTTSGKPFDVDYNVDNGLDGTAAYDKSEALFDEAGPWTSTHTIGLNSTYDYSDITLYVTAQDYDFDTTVTCQIEADGVVLDKESSTGSASCSVYGIVAYL